MQFTLSKMLIAIAMVALACAGLTLRTPLWTESIFSVTVLLYIVTGLAAVGRSGRARISSLAFAFFGGGYLLVVSCNAFSPLRDLLLTNRAIVQAAKLLSVPTVDQKTNAGLKQFVSSSGGFSNPDEYGWNNNFAFGAMIASPQIPTGAFLIIGHCVWSWLLAFLAGWFCGAMWAKRDASRVAPLQTVTPSTHSG
jgi:hypothetical protein